MVRLADKIDELPDGLDTSWLVEALRIAADQPAPV